MNWMSLKERGSGIGRDGGGVGVGRRGRGGAGDRGDGAEANRVGTQGYALP
jgi:hypothetical protein